MEPNRLRGNRMFPWMTDIDTIYILLHLVPNGVTISYKEYYFINFLDTPVLLLIQNIKQDNYSNLQHNKLACIYLALNYLPLGSKRLSNGSWIVNSALPFKWHMNLTTYIT